MKKKIKCWKVILTDLSLQQAIKIVKAKKIETNGENDTKFDRVGFGKNKYEIIEDVDDYPYTAQDILYNDWCIFIPDTNGEEILSKTRELVKNEHILTDRFGAIDNMSIDDIFSKIYMDKLRNADMNVKYRLIKKLIEDKLYK